jgi:hypothetical protein
VAPELFYQLAADVLLVLHALFVAFLVLGVVAIYLGVWLSWGWVRNFWLRLFHLAGIAIVVFQAWAGMICPLTVWEMELRKLSGASGLERYDGSFIQHWVQTLLYYEAPGWVFVVVYTLFGGLIVASWFIVRPRRHE